MPEPEPLLLLAIAAALFTGGLVKGAIGLGLPLVSISLLASFMEVSAAVPLLTISIVLANLWQAIQSKHVRPSLKRFWPLIVTVGVGTIIGAGLIVSANPRILYGVVGGIVIFFVLMGLFGGRLDVPPGAERWLAPVIGCTSGVIGGLTGMFGPLNAMFFASLRLLKDEFVGAIGCTQFFGSAFLLLAFTGTGVLNRDTAVWSALAVLPAFAGMWAGQRLRDRIPQETFRRLILGFLLIVGLNLLRRALF